MLTLSPPPSPFRTPPQSYRRQTARFVAAEIRRLDVAVSPYVCWRSVGDDRTLVEDDDAVGDVHHDVHVVFDQQDGVVRRYVLDEVDDIADALRGDARIRFVQQKYVGVAREGNADLEFALCAVAQRAREVLGPVAAPSRSANLVGALRVPS